MNERKKPLIMLLAAPESSASVLYGLYDVLMSVGAVYPDMVAGTPGKELLNVRIISAEGKPFHCQGNIPVEPHTAIVDQALYRPDGDTTSYEFAVAADETNLYFLAVVHDAHTR